MQNQRKKIESTQLVNFLNTAYGPPIEKQCLEVEDDVISS